MTAKNIVLIDSRVADYETITSSLGEDTEWYLLSTEQDGIAQMQGMLASYSGLESIHVISHGSPGTLQLGSTMLDSDDLVRHAGQLQAIGSSLSPAGDILLYGCNVAQGDVGLTFIKTVAQLTGADVAASDDPTGLAGDAFLEWTTGQIEADRLSLDALETTLAINTAPTFWQRNGNVTTAIGTGRDGGRSVAVQADGKILVAGESRDNNGGITFALVRYNRDGSLDNTFSGSGMVTTIVGMGSQGYSVAVQADGKILVAGLSWSAGYADFALARYNSDGSLDTTFSDDGMVTTAIGSLDDYGYSVAVQADGKILVAGHSIQNGSGGSEFALVRYNRDGNLDTTFSGDGMVTTVIGMRNGAGQSVAIQADGKILVAGSSWSDSGSEFALVRYNSDGSLDATFSGDGIVTTAIWMRDGGQSVAVQADGKILVAGGSWSDSGGEFALARYNSDGSLDTTFSDDGIVTTAIGMRNGGGQSVAIQADGKILVAGISQQTAGHFDFTLVRYNSDGSLDTTFSDDGVVTTTIGVLADSAMSVTVQADGKILVAGDSSNGSSYYFDTDFALVCYNSDGSLDTTFGSHVINGLSGTSTYTEQGNAVVLHSAVQVSDVELSASNYAGASLTLSRHGGASGEDLFSSSGSLAPLTDGAKLIVADTVIGAMTQNNNGILVLTFNASATQDLVNSALQGIAYGNSSDAPPATVQIDWNFSDGNTGAQGGGCALSATGSTKVQIAAVNDAPTGSVTITGTATQGQTLTAANTLADADGLGTIAYQWFADGSAIGGASAATLSLTQAQVGKAITVRASYTDQSGTAESMTSSATTKIANLNDAGAVTISGSATQGQSLAAVISDADGVPSSGITYQWLADGKSIKGAASSTFTPTQAEVGKAISVKAGYKDSFGAAEALTSAATGKIANVNDTPAGAVTISGMATQGQRLTASNTLADLDGLGTIAYQWLADGSAISGATTSTFTLTQGQVGKAIGVKASYTDKFGTAESVSSAATAKVANVNDAPSGGVTLTGTARQGQTLTAAHTLADADGLGTVSYQWLADGTAINEATDSTFTLTQAHVGKAIAVKASYVDGQGTAESKISTSTAKVANVNDAATGAVTISGTAEQGQTLTVTNTLADDDGIGTVKYQWLVDGVAIKGATTPTFALTQSHVGKAISVKASYKDLLGTAESVNSVATGKVANVNDAPTGTVTIGGTVTQGQKLTATHKLADVDGLGTVSYQWLADGNAINGATAPTITLGQEQVGKTISVKASYVDGQGTAESVTSIATAMVGSQSKTGTGGDDLLVGGADKDLLSGLAGNDVIYGGAGNDTLVGGAGADLLTGGAGRDVFKFTALSELGLGNSARDTIADFKAAEDKIDLSAIDTNGSVKGDQAFVWVTGFSATAGQVRFVADGQGSGILYLNTDTDADAEYEILLAGVTTLAAASIAL